MSEYKDMSDSEKKKEDWMNSKWRPMMGWMYMVVCTMDMVIFPILWSLLQTLNHAPITQWQPLTLQGAGLFHIAMGAVLGLAAWGRTQEKLGGANNGGLQPMGSGSPTAFGATAPTTGGFQAPAPTSFGSPSTAGGFNSGGFGSVPSAPTAGGFGGFGSAPAPITTTASGKKVVPDDPQPVI
jgi:hypothetical protein